MSDREDDRGTRVYVGGLSDGVKKEDLEGEFEKFGKLNSVWVAFNPPGFAFIEFHSHSDAETACDNLNGADFLGSKLRVEIARGKGRRGGSGGSGGFRGTRGSRGSSRGGNESGGGFRSSFRDGASGGGSFRGSSRGGGRGRGGFREDFGGGRRDSSGSGGGGGSGGAGAGTGGGGTGTGGRFSNEYNRNGRDGFRRGGRESFGGRGGGGRRYDGDRFRSRSPVGGPRH